MDNFTFNTNQKTDYLSFSVSVALHGIGCCLLCFFPIPPSKPKTAIDHPYSVTFDIQSFTKAPQQSLSKLISPEKQKMTTHAQSIKPVKNHPIPKKANSSPISQQPDEQPISTEPVDNTAIAATPVVDSHIDTRGLYKGHDDDNCDNTKKKNASLELPGWIWDAPPEPIDDTAEIGKLVFRITIDDAGEIIGIQTLTTTVSPIVEQRYKNAVASLTFSKTSTEWEYTSTSVGKITFILQYA